MKLFISKIHYKNKLDFLEILIYPFLRSASLFYSLIVKLRNYLYDNSYIKPYKAGALVVSVGNLTTGGVGKTPVAIEIAKYFISQNKKTAVILRGYGGRLSNGKVNVISDSKTLLHTADEAGDEAFLIAENCPQAIVLTCKNRIKAAKKAIDDFKVEVIILDDAYQHRKIERDINLLLIDNKNKFGNAKLLPLGPLREPFEEIKRADKIVLVNKNYDDEEALKYCLHLEKKFKKNVYLCKMIPDVIYNIKTDDVLPLDSEIMAFCAIGQPKEFYAFLRDKYNLLVTVDFEDHHLYDKGNIKELVDIANKEGIKTLVTTEKDAVKIKKMFLEYKTDINIYALKLKAYLDLEEICNGVE